MDEIYNSMAEWEKDNSPRTATGEKTKYKL